jgi:DNA-binding SARP family transcriptional activator/tetratricopeptide (TPR) repeat protein
VEIVTTKGSVFTVGAPKRRSVLAALALTPNQLLDTHTLIGRVWGDEPPAHARTALQGHISALRKVITGPALLQSRASGYQLVTKPDAVDAELFDRLLTSAKGQPDHEAAAVLQQALGLWRGPALAGTAGSFFLSAAGARLTDNRLHAIEDLAERLLRLGRPAEACTLLDEHVSEHPLREELAALAVRAMHAAGRRSEAFDVYRRTRHALAEDLGVEPSEVLRREREALVEGRLPAAAPAKTARPIPAQLPPRTAGFTGRDQELAELRDCDRQIVVLCGQAGVGKTTLALQHAHRISGNFPDGQLFADLRGYDEREPQAAEDVLGRFLHALAVEETDVPAHLDERSALYRSLTAGRRMLVVLDNCRDAAQIRPLLPGASGCLTLVTSRDRLESLVAREGAAHLGLDVLTPEAATDVIAGVIGPRRVAAEPKAARALVRLCDRLPLALRIVAAQLATHRDWRIQRVVDGLADEQQRVSAMVTPDRAVGASLALSVRTRALTRQSQRVFQLLGVHPGPDVDRLAASALFGTDVAKACRHLDEFAEAHLVVETAPGRYSRHDLVRLYTSQLVRSDPECAVAERRLIDYFLHTVGVARLMLEPRPPLFDGPVEHPPKALPEFRSAADILAWVDAEERTIRALVKAAALHGDHARAWRLAYRIGVLHYRCSNKAWWLEILQPGLESARRLGDRPAQRLLLSNMGLALAELGRHDEAVAKMAEALAMARELGDRQAECTVLNNLGESHLHTGRIGEARDCLERAVHIAHEIGEPYLEAKWVSNLSLAAMQQGATFDAMDHVDRAFALLADIPLCDAHVLAYARRGLVQETLNQPADALAQYERALALARQLGDRRYEEQQLRHVARVVGILHGTDAATGYVDQSTVLRNRLGLSRTDGSSGGANTGRIVR